MNRYDGKPFIVIADQDLNREAWAQYDDAAEVFSVATSKDMEGFIGEAENLLECRQVALTWLNELRAF